MSPRILRTISESRLRCGCDEKNPENDGGFCGFDVVPRDSGGGSKGIRASEHDIWVKISPGLGSHPHANDDPNRHPTAQGKTNGASQMVQQGV